MLKDLFKEVQESTTFEDKITIKKEGGGEVTIFIKGRVLSLNEIEKASIASMKVLGALGGAKALQEIEDAQKALRDKEKSDEEKIDQAIDIMSRVKEQRLANNSADEDRIIVSCLTHASADGENWEKFNLVYNHDQQNWEKLRFWVGMIDRADRDRILAKAMRNYEEAREGIATFRK